MAAISNLVSVNRRTMLSLVLHHKQGIETTVRTLTNAWDIHVVFEGARAYTHLSGKTIVLPNVDVFAERSVITDEDIDTARAYFLALRGYAWSQAAKIVETDFAQLKTFGQKQGSFAVGLAIGLDDIRAEHRFISKGQGISETIEYMREQWVWPRFARNMEKNGSTNLLQEVLVGLQVMLKHYDQREDHIAWKALSNEARTFVERCADHLDAAFDTLKMGKVEGTERLTDVAMRMLGQWEQEYALVAPIAQRKKVQKAKKDHDNAADEDERVETSLDVAASLSALLNVELPPLLLVTYSARISSLVSTKFAGQYVQRVEHVPTNPEQWQKLETLQPGETRTLVIHPPNPEHERQLDEMMGKLMQAMAQLNHEMAKEAQKKVDEVKAEIQKYKSDEKPYLVYTTKNDKFGTTPDGDPVALQRMRDDVMLHYGVVKRRLQILLRTKTMTRWRDRQEEGEQLDPNAMADIAMAHLKPQSRLMPFRQRQAKDGLLNTKVGIITDVSGSMQSTKMHLAKQATLCFAECLDLARIKFAAWTFTSDEHQGYRVMEKTSASDQELYARFGALNIETVKGFNEHWMHVAKRLPMIGHDSQANYDADSVQWAAQQLLSQKAKRRVMFVLSDGQPSTGEPPLQVARQQLQLSKVVQAIAREGVEVVGIGICDDSVKEYYPHHVVVESAKDLPRVVMEQMNFLLLAKR